MIRDNLTKLTSIIKPSDTVLDVGGWHSPLNRSNAMIDIMPFATRNQAGAILKDVWPDEQFSESTYVQADICKTLWPYKDKEFDFVLCSHTLEDVRDPVAVCEEIIRVGKAGYIEIPSRLVESTKGIERPFYCGYYHHRWLCEMDGATLTFLFKPAMLHAYRRFHFSKSPLKKVNPKYEATGFFWEKTFSFREKIVIDRDDVQNDLMSFKQKFLPLKDLFVPKYNWKFQRI